MLVPGLVSATFPELPVPEVIRLAADTGFRAIEWVAAEPVPPAEKSAARVGAACRAAGIAVCSYGSDYRAGASDPASFPEILRTARVLGARSVQVWAGAVSSSDASVADWSRTVQALRSAADTAADHGVRIGLRYRRNTLADTLTSAQQLLREVSQDNLSASWRPRAGQSPSDALTEFRALLPGLSMVHLPASSGLSSAASGSAVDGAHGPPPLAGQAELWQPVLAELAARPETRYALLTVGADGSRESFRRDAETLRSWLK